MTSSSWEAGPALVCDSGPRLNAAAVHINIFVTRDGSSTLIIAAASPPEAAAKSAPCMRVVIARSVDARHRGLTAHRTDANVAVVIEGYARRAHQLDLLR